MLVRYGVALPNYGELASPENLIGLARHAEAAGLESVWVSDHVIVPEAVASVYPYDRSPTPQAAKLAHLERFYDALTTLAFVAGATSRIRLGVSVYVLPIRNPIVTAKTVATLDALSHGRVIFAIGTGGLAEEFAVLHTPFADRGARTDEYIQICKTCWTQDAVQLDGPSYATTAFRCAPKPVQRPHPPVWIGGNGGGALRRAARLGDGWHPIDLTPTAMAEKTAALHQLCAAEGRRRDAVTVSLRMPFRLTASDAAAPLVGTADKIVADVAAYQAAGVEYLVLNPRRAATMRDVLRDVDDMARVLL
jgi:probable F420-dependent oxidoreductase